MKLKCKLTPETDYISISNKPITNYYDIEIPKPGYYKVKANDMLNGNRFFLFDRDQLIKLKNYLEKITGEN